MPYLVSCVINMVWTRMKRTRNPNPYIRSQLPDLFLFIVDGLPLVGDDVKATGACCLTPVGVTWPRWFSGRWLPRRGIADFCIRCYNSPFPPLLLFCWKRPVRRPQVFWQIDFFVSTTFLLLHRQLLLSFSNPLFLSLTYSHSRLGCFRDLYERESPCHFQKQQWDGLDKHEI